jgi:hypothetical protein
MLHKDYNRNGSAEKVTGRESQGACRQVTSPLTLACSAWEVAADTYLLKLQRLKQRSAHLWMFSKMDTGPRFAHVFQSSVYIQLYDKIVHATRGSHTKS